MVDDDHSTVAEEESESGDETFIPEPSALSSPLPTFPDNRGISCWSKPDHRIFMVRSSTYLDDRVKLVMMAGVFSSYRNSFFAMNHCICNCLPGVMQYGEMSDVVALHAPRPVLLINGQRDKSAPIADARQGLGKLKRVYTLLGVPKRIEADFFDGPHEWSNGKTLEFLSKHFGK